MYVKYQPHIQSLVHLMSVKCQPEIQFLVHLMYVNVAGPTERQRLLPEAIDMRLPGDTTYSRSWLDSACSFRLSSRGSQIWLPVDSKSTDSRTCRRSITSSVAMAPAAATGPLQPHGTTAFQHSMLLCRQLSCLPLQIFRIIPAICMA